MEIRREARARQVRHLPLAAPVRVHHPEIHLEGAHQVLRQQRAVLGRVRRRCWMVGAVHDQRAVGRKKRPPIVPQRAREPPQTAAVHSHRVDVQVAVAQRREHDRRAVGRERPLRVVSRVGRQAARAGAVGGGRVDVVVVQGPHVAAGVIGTRGTRRAGVLGARIEDPAIVIEEVAARGASPPGRHAVQPAPVRPHHVHLVALLVGTLALEDQQPSRRGEIRFGVLPAEGELPQVAKMELSRVRRERSLRERDHQHQGQGHRTRKLGMDRHSGNVLTYALALRLAEHTLQGVNGAIRLHVHARPETPPAAAPDGRAR